MAYDRLAKRLGTHKLADADARLCGVIGDDREVALALPHDLIDHTLGRTDTHKAADHQACAVRNHLDGAIEQNRLHVLSTAVAVSVCRRTF